jgi:hypothetical protein
LSSYTNTVTYIKNLDLVKDVRTFLTGVYRQCIARHSVQPPEAERAFNAREVIAIYLTKFPDSVFENRGPVEENLIVQSGILLNKLRDISRAISQTGSFSAVPHELTEDFCPILFSYLRAFRAFRTPDEVILFESFDFCFIN